MDKELRQKWVDKKFLHNDYPEDKVEELLGLYEEIEKWELKVRKKGGPFNEQFCSDVYAIASITTKEGTFKGKFKPDELYEEIKTTMKEYRKGKEGYSLYDEAKVLGMVMDNHRKKTPTKK
jgi:hypothetical protein